MKIIILLCLIAISCSNKAPMSINHGNIKPGSSVEIQGKTFELSNEGHLKENDDFLKLTQNLDLDFKFNNKVTLINIVPSIDTKVCEEQTHILGENKSIHSEIERVTISRDLPTAQKRFAEAAKLTNIVFYSDYKTASFGKKTGLLIKDNMLLTRGIVVLDSKGKVRYQQFVSELTELPDMDKAIKLANSLVQ